MVRSTECGFAVKEYRLARRRELSVVCRMLIRLAKVKANKNDSSSKVDEAPTADTFAALCRPVTILRGMLPKSTRQCRAKRKWL
ncbi:hypothetical protein RB195_003708 [Necator americanus]